MHQVSKICAIGDSAEKIKRFADILAELALSEESLDEASDVAAMLRDNIDFYNDRILVETSHMVKLIQDYWK